MGSLVVGLSLVWRGVLLVFLLAYFGRLRFCQCLCYCTRPVAGQCPAPRVSCFLLHFNACAFKCSHSVTVLRALGGHFSSLQLFFFSTELLIQCDRCLGWTWCCGQGSWLGCGRVFLLPGLGVGSSSPQVPWHPTFMCDSDINLS